MGGHVFRVIPTYEPLPWFMISNEQALHTKVQIKTIYSLPQQPLKNLRHRGTGDK